MARVCQITGKKPSRGNTRSHALNSTRRSFRPNLVKKKVFNPATGRMEKMKISTRALRTLNKKMR